jgi:hypothetical protein
VPVAEAAVAFLQRDHVGIDLAQDRQDPLGIALAVEPHRLVDVVAGNSDPHRRQPAPLRSVPHRGNVAG